jgi:rhodanese-related sulfurtransferase
MDGDYSPRQVAELHTRGEVELVDVRELDEHQAGRIGGERHIPLGELSDQAESLDPTRPIVFYCRTGSRSAMATQAFRRAGYDAHNMTGGLVEWHASGLPIVPDGGHVA